MLLQLPTWKRLVAVEGTRNKDILTLPLHLPHVEMKLDVLVLALPLAALSLHRTENLESKYPISELTVKESGEVLDLANGARLVHVLQSDRWECAVIQYDIGTPLLYTCI